MLYDCLHCCRKALWRHDVCLVNRWLQLKLQLPQETSGCSKACVDISGIEQCNYQVTVFPCKRETIPNEKIDDTGNTGVPFRGLQRNAASCMLLQVSVEQDSAFLMHL